MFDLLVNPDSFFRERAEDPPALPPLAIVAVVALIGGVSAFLVTQQVSVSLPDEAQQFALIGAVVGAVIAVLVTAVIWVVTAGVAHAVSGFLYETDGDLKDTLLCTGYGYAPRILGAAVGVVATYLAYQTVPVPADATNQQAIQEFSRAVASSPYTLVSSVVTLVVLVWQWFLWSFALKHVRSLTLREGAISAGVPLGLMFLWNAYNLVGTLA